jgi:hypothetical protein
LTRQVAPNRADLAPAPDPATAPARTGLARLLVRAVLGDGLLVLAGTALPGEALHLSAADAVPAVRPRLLGRSCHDAGEVARAAQQGCDWVSVSPIWTTASKPGYGPALGVPGLAALLPGAPPAYGVAVLGAVRRADRPEQVVAGLLPALGESG